MEKFDTRRVAEGLTAYAIERQHGWERRQREGAPTWMEQRRFWTDAILQGMARLDGGQPDPALMERFDRELEQDRGCYLFTPATRQTQKDTIRELRRFTSALEDTGDDRRRQVDVADLYRQRCSGGGVERHHPPLVGLGGAQVRLRGAAGGQAGGAGFSRRGPAQRADDVMYAVGPAQTCPADFRWGC